MRKKLASQLPVNTAIVYDGEWWTKGEIYGVGAYITEENGQGEMDVIIDSAISGEQVQEMLKSGIYNLWPKFTDDTIGRDYELKSVPPLEVTWDDIFSITVKAPSMRVASNQIYALIHPEMEEETDD